MTRPVTPRTIAPTTAQSLGALLKSARDIMRKDKGLNGDLDRLPMLTWIMFLKFLDDLELQRECETKLTTHHSPRQARVAPPRRALRTHPPRDARCGGRSRRVLPPARRRAPHGHGPRPAPRRTRARPRQWHGRFPRRSVQPFVETGQN